jgi:hypothetical protein
MNKEELEKELEEAQASFQLARDKLVSSSVYQDYEVIGKRVTALLKAVQELKQHH